ncbi:ABC transporter substrate-binding protein [Dongshaea marina]|uniref:ABC transporter substrate-binding protein n=1 Tax=Dongshaea marina TaxID=2047966 RepID=UPI000D3E2575|nr:ABC transporter substrate-binding protein [Dongshaea marina]
MVKGCLLFGLLLFSLRVVATEPLHVLLLNPGAGNWFWKQTIEFMQAASEDLGIELEVLDSEKNMLAVTQLREIVDRPHLPDYLLISNENGIGGDLLRIADRADLKTFLFINGFESKRDRREYGKPRQYYKSWIGELIPDNYSAGYQMGTVLLDKALKQGMDKPYGKVQLAAIAGTSNTQASSERVRGLGKAVSEREDRVKLLKIVAGDWTQQRAFKLSLHLFTHYPNIQAFWGVNDSTAIGEIQAALDKGKQPGKDLLFVSCGWHPQAIDKVSRGELVATIGGISWMAPGRW